MNLHNVSSMRKGQVLVVVMLVLAIAVTVGLAISSRSATEISVSTTQDESSKALEAAQVGLERYLGQIPYPVSEVGGGSGDLPEMNASYFVPNPTSLGNSSSYQVPYFLSAGEVATIDMPSGATDYNGVRLCWGNGGVQPKLEVAVYYCQRENGSQTCTPPNITGQYYVRRKAYNPGSGAAYENFVNTSGPNDCGISGANFDYHVSIRFDTNDSAQNILLPDLGSTGNRVFFLRVRMLGNGANAQPLAGQILGSGVNFPAQAGVVESIGTSGDSVQKIKATVITWDLPSVFDAAIFSGTDIVK